MKNDAFLPLRAGLDETVADFRIGSSSTAPFANAGTSAAADERGTAATAAALGVKMFVPAPCIPVIPAPWSTGSVSCKLKNLSLLTKDSKLNCAMGGIIEISNPAVQNVKNS